MLVESKIKGDMRFHTVCHAFVEAEAVGVQVIEAGQARKILGRTVVVDGLSAEDGGGKKWQGITSTYGWLVWDPEDAIVTRKVGINQRRSLQVVGKR
jgi:hypothetical protein